MRRRLSIEYLRRSIADRSRENIKIVPWSGPFKDMAPGRWKWCFYCGVVMTDPPLSLHGVNKMPDATRTRDHIVPHSRGGRGHDNYLDCCARCNFDKSDLTLLQFMLIRRKAARKTVKRDSFIRRAHERIRQGLPV